MSKKEEEEMVKVGVQCHLDHKKIKGEMEKSGSESCLCPYCGKKIKKN